MGKRKHLNESFYQCDWTGLQMRAPYAYMPHFAAEGKLVRRGSYCNWECVVAAMQHMMGNETDGWPEI